MIVVDKIKEVREVTKEWTINKESIGYVPTMGFLHEGHKSLIDKARLENDKVVVSIFVNPTQFGEGEDLDAYPRDLERDLELCKNAGVDMVFVPQPSEMYFKDATTKISMETLSEELCGKSRPVHFGGVCTVVTKLFNIVNPTRAYFGEKDAQQLAIIKRMVRDLNFDVEVIGCPIVRESDGLAKSSRNTYLSKEEREAAIVLHKSLEIAKSIIENGERNVSVIIENIERVIKAKKLAKIDYIEVVDSKSIQKVDVVEEDVLVAIAIYIGKTRLIDNFTYRF
ncbi:MAG: pantoate--beta-alanine ligase [Sarcina sp.]